MGNRTLDTANYFDVLVQVGVVGIATLFCLLTRTDLKTGDDNLSSGVGRTCSLRKDRVLPLTISSLSCSPFYTAMISKYVFYISPHCPTTHFIFTERLPARHAIGGS